MLGDFDREIVEPLYAGSGYICKDRYIVQINTECMCPDCTDCSCSNFLDKAINFMCFLCVVYIIYSYSSYDVSVEQLSEDFGCTEILNKEKKFESIIFFFG
ncbi:hypothetical protein BpHYR1_037241 [Brachionus plicatilis]|uniref:Uncharacterized protein n=1 Tax=Brachionus plicatilis TaxID=10195 RepID=A0A3M7T552_BRAPC|nr:hypothetical protein BpHYR1_037241 [Brachionus plicatilis]